MQSVIRAGKFDEREDKWPVTFEYDFAVRWIKHAVVKGVLDDSPVERRKDHVSTYAR